MKKSTAIIILVCTIGICALVLTMVYLWTHRNVESDEFEQESSTQEEPSDEFIEELVIAQDGNDLQDIIDKRAAGEDTGTSTIVIPEAEYDINDKGYDSANNRKPEDVPDQVLGTVVLSTMPSDYQPAKNVDKLSYLIIRDDVLNIQYGFQTLLESIGESEFTLVKAPVPYYFECRDFWLISVGSRVLTIVNADDSLYLIDQGVPVDESVKSRE